MIAASLAAALRMHESMTLAADGIASISASVAVMMGNADCVECSRHPMIKKPFRLENA